MEIQGRLTIRAQAMKTGDHIQNSTANVNLNYKDVSRSAPTRTSYDLRPGYELPGWRKRGRSLNLYTTLGAVYSAMTDGRPPPLLWVLPAAHLVLFRPARAWNSQQEHFSAPRAGMLDRATLHLALARVSHALHARPRAAVCTESSPFHPACPYVCQPRTQSLRACRLPART